MLSRLLICSIMLLSVQLVASEGPDSTFCTSMKELNYVTPSELISTLMLEQVPSSGYRSLVGSEAVYLKFISANNQVLMSGSNWAITELSNTISAIDVPPRQIVIEVKIVEVDVEKMNETGLDWQNLLDNTDVNMSFISSKSIYDDADEISQEYSEDQFRNGFSQYRENETLDRTTNADHRRNGFTLDSRLSRMSVGDLIKIVHESGSGNVVNIPKIVTINNKTGKILDGHRITYVSKYSSYSNLFESEEMTAGISLAVTPSLGKSGYLRMDVVAKITSLGEIISGSPSESGQILENTVIVKDCEPFLLGGFKQVQTQKIKRKVPLLGVILPFLFSRDVNIEVTKDILLVLTPKVIDLNSPVIEEIMGENQKDK
ncbi:hypothetical protein HQ585_13020 [candidate division KSB1 bacterium]|nr:hypothetical protein [candidate division KSB1 bacterium]